MGKMRVQLHTYLASVLDVDERSAAHTHTHTPAPFPRIQGHVTFWATGLVSSSIVLNTLEQTNIGIKVHIPLPGVELRTADGLLCNLISTPSGDLLSFRQHLQSIIGTLNKARIASFHGLQFHCS
jgi:hypothetical protein